MSTTSLSPPPFDRLTDDLLREVLSWLRPRDLAAAASVCGRWLEQSRCDELWGTVLERSVAGWERVEFLERDLRACVGGGAGGGVPVRTGEAPQSSDGSHGGGRVVSAGTKVQLPWRQIMRARHAMPRAVVLDAGSGYCKYGWSDEEEPSGRIATFLEFGNVESPVLPRLATLFRGVFATLGAHPHEQPIVISEPLCYLSETRAAQLARRQLRESTCAVLFNRLNVPAVCPINQASLALFAAHLTSGIVVNVGFRVTTVVPIVRGRILTEWEEAWTDHPGSISVSATCGCGSGGGNSGAAVGVEMVPLGAMRVTGCLAQLMDEAGIPCDNMFAVRTVKEELCYVAKNFEEEERAVREGRWRKHKTCVVAEDGGRAYSLGPERYRSTEVLMQPWLCGLSCGGVQDAVIRCIQRCEAYAQRLEQLLQCHHHQHHHQQQNHQHHQQQQQQQSEHEEEGVRSDGACGRSNVTDDAMHVDCHGRPGAGDVRLQGPAKGAGSSGSGSGGSCGRASSGPVCAGWGVRSTTLVNPSDVRAMMGNVVLAGGTGALPGLAERLEAELKKGLLVGLRGATDGVGESCAAAPAALGPVEVRGRTRRCGKVPMRVHANKHGYNAAWVGGSLVAQTSAFASEWCVTRESYRQDGCEVVHGMVAGSWRTLRG